jgi:hypothetical protein
MYKVIPTTTYTVRDSISYYSVGTSYKTEAEAQNAANVANEATESAEKNVTAKLTKEFAAIQATKNIPNNDVMV